MIKPGEIQNKSREAKVRDQQIEKDYILSWILQGIAQHVSLKNAIVFKGGTVLKKVYFSDYRFSEDLDFTLVQAETSNEQILGWFEEIFEYIQEQANIPLKIVNSGSHEDLPEQEDAGINFYVNYIGPLGGQGNNKKVKIDISRNENLVFDVVNQDVILSYSDLESHQLFCYSLEEVLVEKLRSIMQRMQPRDFYDVWYLSVVHEMNPDLYINEFNVKCGNKGVNPAEFHDKLNQRLPQYQGRWQKSIANQIHDLLDFEQLEREVLRKLKKFML